MKDSLVYDEKNGFWYDEGDEESTYTQEGIRLAVYEDLKDTLNYLYSECAYWVACSSEITYNYIMDHLYEYVKENMDFTKSNFNNEEMSDEELFDVVMENVISSVEYYGWVNYKRDKENNENG